MNIQTEVVNLEYERAAKLRWEAVRKKRGLSASAPFVGDSIKEASVDALDFGNCWRVAYDRGYIPEDVWREGTMAAMGLWTAAQTFSGD